MFEKICFHKEFIEYSIIGFRFLCTLLYPSSRDELGSVFLFTLLYPSSRYDGARRRASLCRLAHAARGLENANWLQGVQA